MAGLGLTIALAAVCSLGSLVILAIQALIFLMRGRTLGMACVGLRTAAGSRPLALLLGVLAAIVPAGVAVLVSSGMDSSTQHLLVVAVPLGAMGLELAFALAPGARTLTDRIAGIRWRVDGSPGKKGGAAFVVDALVLAALSAPTLFVFDWDDAAAAVLASTVGAGLFVTLEMIVLAASQGTIGMRALQPAP
jgi:hypothetical protein